jgi:hypothetical protein
MAITKRRVWCPYVEKGKSRGRNRRSKHWDAVSDSRISTNSQKRRNKNPGEIFFKQFPKGCPNCGAAKKWITFPEIRVPRSLRKAAAISSGKAKKGDEGRGNSVLGSISKIVTLHVDDIKRFAECAMCHEAWVWQDEAERWINAGEVATRHTRNKTK